MYTEKQVGTWQSIPDLETEQGDFSGEINFYPLQIKIVSEWETVLRILIVANNWYLLQISQILMKRSITQLLLPTIPKINGIHANTNQS
jgi:hypothetical protein